MKISDPIYGKFEIREPIILKLLSSPSVTRLKNISQYGIPDKYYHFKNFSRYEHSVGVMLILRKFGSTIEEQIAGLLHDISVLAFSHVADWVFSEGNKGIEDYHNKIHKDFVNKSEIPSVLKYYGFLPEKILNEENFSLLERSSPNLCADRIDYALREFKYWLNPKIVSKCLKDLKVYNQEFVFNNKNSALLFALHFLDLQVLFWGGVEAILRYNYFSEILKEALDTGIINEKDFYADESTILEKVEKSLNKKIVKKLAVLGKKPFKKAKSSGKNKIYKKFRYVDPKVLENNEIKILSLIDPEFQQTIEKHRKIAQRGVLV